MRTACWITKAAVTNSEYVILTAFLRQQWLGERASMSCQMGKLRDLHYELLEHPPYCPDLAPSDFCLFPKLKLFLADQHFVSNQEAIAAVEGYFADVTKNRYRDGIMVLEHRWNKCICLKGDYVEK